MIVWEVSGWRQRKSKLFLSQLNLCCSSAHQTFSANTLTGKKLIQIGDFQVGFALFYTWKLRNLEIETFESNRPMEQWLRLSVQWPPGNLAGAAITLPWDPPVWASALMQLPRGNDDDERQSEEIRWIRWRVTVMGDVSSRSTVFLYWMHFSSTRPAILWPSERERWGWRPVWFTSADNLTIGHRRRPFIVTHFDGCVAQRSEIGPFYRTASWYVARPSRHIEPTTFFGANGVAVVIWFDKNCDAMIDEFNCSTVKVAKL